MLPPYTPTFGPPNSIIPRSIQSIPIKLSMAARTKKRRAPPINTQKTGEKVVNEHQTVKNASARKTNKKRITKLNSCSRAKPLFISSIAQDAAKHLFAHLHHSALRLNQPPGQLSYLYPHFVSDCFASAFFLCRLCICADSFRIIFG